MLTSVKRRARGFTIIELVVTLALFGVLMGRGDSVLAQQRD